LMCLPNINAKYENNWGQIYGT